MQPGPSLWYAGEGPGIENMFTELGGKGMEYENKTSFSTSLEEVRKQQGGSRRKKEKSTTGNSLSQGGEKGQNREEDSGGSWWSNEGLLIPSSNK